MEEIESEDTGQCKQNTHFIWNLLDNIINNALGKLEKFPDKTKIRTCHTNEMSTIIQQFTSDETLIPIPNDIYTSITENHLLYLSLTLMRVLID